MSSFLIESSNTDESCRGLAGGVERVGSSALVASTLALMVYRFRVQSINEFTGICNWVLDLMDPYVL